MPASVCVCVHLLDFSLDSEGICVCMCAYGYLFVCQSVCTCMCMSVCMDTCTSVSLPQFQQSKVACICILSKLPSRALTWISAEISLLLKLNETLLSWNRRMVFSQLHQMDELEWISACGEVPLTTDLQFQSKLAMFCLIFKQLGTFVTWTFAAVMCKW